MRAGSSPDARIIPMDIFNLKGRVALVTGGSKGLGKAMAKVLAQAGADIVICSRHESQLRLALDDILQGTGGRGRYLVADLAVRSETERLARKALEWSGGIDILVNNAGVNMPEPIDEVSDQKWDRTLELNLNAPMALTRALTPQMKRKHWGRIIHISSIMGIASKAGRNSYSATKSALLGLMKANALDLGPFNITVNCIAPGPFETEMTSQILTEAQKKVSAARTALGRWGHPEEVAGPALLLASEAGSYISGCTLLVDGGLLCKTF